VLSHCYRLLRKKRLPVVPLDSELEIATTRESVALQELKEALWQLIDQLPVNTRLIVILFYIGGYSHEDISEFLKLPKTTVAKRLYTARSQLKEAWMSDLKDSFDAHRPSRNDSFAEKVAQGIFDGYLGLYQFEERPELTVTISKDNGRLISESAGQINELIAHNDSETELCTKEYQGKGRFIKNAQGEVTHFIYFEFGRELGRARKIG
jgi:hypothetical protein